MMFRVINPMLWWFYLFLLNIFIIIFTQNPPSTIRVAANGVFNRF